MSTELSSSLKLKLTTGVAFSSIFLFILSFAYILPAIINKNGVKEILKLKRSEEDQAKFDHSCDIMKENIKNEIDPMLKQ